MIDRLSIREIEELNGSQPKRPWPRPRPRQRPRRRSHAKGQSAHLPHQRQVRSLPKSASSRKAQPTLTLKPHQTILPHRWRRPRRPPLHLQGPLRRRVRHRLHPPHLQHPAARAPGRRRNPRHAQLVLRPQGRGRGGPGSVVRVQRVVHRARQRPRVAQIRS